jgi:hypothetical protein
MSLYTIESNQAQDLFRVVDPDRETVIATCRAEAIAKQICAFFNVGRRAEPVDIPGELKKLRDLREHDAAARLALEEREVDLQRDLERLTRDAVANTLRLENRIDSNREEYISDHDILRTELEQLAQRADLACNGVTSLRQEIMTGKLTGPKPFKPKAARRPRPRSKR